MRDLATIASIDGNCIKTECETYYLHIDQVIRRGVKATTLSTSSDPKAEEMVVFRFRNEPWITQNVNRNPEYLKSVLQSLSARMDISPADKQATAHKITAIAQAVSIALMWGMRLDETRHDFKAAAFGHADGAQGHVLCWINGAKHNVPWTLPVPIVAAYSSDEATVEGYRNWVEVTQESYDYISPRGLRFAYERAVTILNAVGIDAQAIIAMTAV